MNECIEMCCSNPVPLGEALMILGTTFTCFGLIGWLLSRQIDNTFREIYGNDNLDEE